MEEYRIFIGSPSDVWEERKIIEEVIEEMNEYYEHLDVPKLKLISLKKDVRSKIGNFEGQSVIDKQINDKYNVFIGILWKKFGTKTENYDSGTEQEFYIAFEKYEKDPKTMEIMFYFCERNVDFNEIDGEQLALVQKFRKNLGDKGLYKTYSSIEDFKEMIKNDLIILIKERNIDFEDASYKDELEVNDGLIDLLEDFNSSFNKSILEMEYLTVDIYETERNLNELTVKNNDSQNIDVMKKYFNSVAVPINEFSDKVDSHGMMIVDYLNEGIGYFNSLINIHGDFILNNNQIDSTLDAMGGCYNSIKELDNAINDLLKIMNGLQPITTIFSKSKRRLVKSLNTFLRRLMAIQKVIKESEAKLLEFKK